MPDSLRISLLTLLQQWGEGLLRHQIAEGDNRGGLWCPDCERIHGRCGDAVAPFLTLARLTGEARFVGAAQEVFGWSQRHVSQPDGSFINDEKINPWNGITVFSALALAHALHFHGDLLPAKEREIWTARLESAAEWICQTDWANHGTINYPISAAAALAGAAQVLGEEKYLVAARRWAHWSRDFFLPDGLLHGEGARTPSARGFYAVDALYNLEESLPNLAFYAEIANDEPIRKLVLKSFNAHLDFVLPDGSYDAGWGSRAFKWTLWGSRTSDGIAGLLPLSRFDARIGETVRRNLEFLLPCTHNGLLCGGPHLQDHGRAACIHHTFAHAKALAVALDCASEADFLVQNCELPCDAARGVWTRESLGTTFVSVQKWRASFTTSDVFYGARGSRPSGGAATMIWHADTGPLCVSSMSRYTPAEPGNMAAVRREQEISILTPRIEHGDFSSELDEGASLKKLENGVRASGFLTDADYQRESSFWLETRFEDDSVHFFAAAETGAMLVLPIVSSAAESVNWDAHRVEITKAGARVVIESENEISGDSSRVFHFVPGVQAVQMSLAMSPEGVRVSMRVEKL